MTRMHPSGSRSRCRAMRTELGKAWTGGVLAVGLLALASCATQPPLEQRLQVWIGRSEGDLVSAFGVPAGTYAVGDRKFLQFDQWRTQIVPGSPVIVAPYGRWGGWGWGGAWQTPSTAIMVGCSVTFGLRQGNVDGFSFRGEGCR